MSISPNKILLRLKELKIWQETQEQLLQKKSSYQRLGVSSLETSSVENSPEKRQSVNWEFKKITPIKPFEQLLEEKMSQDPGPVKIIQKPKQPFLRKGSGLQRYRLKPNERKPPPCKAIKKNSNINNKKNETNIDIAPLKVPEIAIKPKGTWCKVLEVDPEIAENKINEPGETTLYENAIEKELRIFEALEKRAEDSSFCSTNSSIIQIFASSPRKVRAKKQMEAPIIEEKIVRFSDDEKWSTSEPSDCNSSASSSVSSSDLQETMKTIETCDVGVNTNNDICSNCGSELREKIMEYQAEIEGLREEKDKLIEMRKEMQRKSAILENEERKKRREFEDERKLMMEELEIEKKKILKEKMVFETYVKNSQNRPNKKEREEISNLKKELADAKELLKLKESKSGTTQARLRNQIKALEKDNEHLKFEIDKLMKANAKLSAFQKVNRRSSDTRVLQEINKTLNKLSQDGLKQQQKPDFEQNKNRQTTNYNKEDDDGFTRGKSRESPKRLGANSEFTRIASIEKLYENVFGKSKKEETDEESSEEHRNSDVSRKDADKVENVFEDGTKEIKYANGNVKTISPDGNFVILKYYNNDIKETNMTEGRIRYFYADTKIWQTNYPDGSEMEEFPNGLVEKKYKDGKREVFFPDGVIQTIFPGGSEEIKYLDGSVAHIKDDVRILQLPNGQREIHTKKDKRREYPDGTVKILYPDGSQETKYTNGRIRIKDPNGVLIMDTFS